MGAIVKNNLSEGAFRMLFDVDADDVDWALGVTDIEAD